MVKMRVLCGGGAKVLVAQAAVLLIVAAGCVSAWGGRFNRFNTQFLIIPRVYAINTYPPVVQALGHPICSYCWDAKVYLNLITNKGRLQTGAIFVALRREM